MHPFLIATLGGITIGLAVTGLLAFNGRTAGVSGILNQALSSRLHDSLWRWSFLVGLIAGGVILRIWSPEFFYNSTGRSFLNLLSAGFLVGFGSVLANGCTSGHGVCGISRFSIRSLVATGLFIFAGVSAVVVFKILGWSL